MSIRPGNLGSVLIDTGVGTVASETYNPQTKTEYGTGGTTGTAYGGTYEASDPQSPPETLPIQS